MTKIPLPTRAAVLLAAILCTASCDRQPTQTTAADSTPQATPDKQGVTFGEGFYKEEVAPTGAFRWVRQTARAHLTVPEAGRYQLTFRPVTVFSPRENTIAVSVNGQPVGDAATHTCDFANPQATKLPADLKAGDNEITLKSNVAEVQLDKDDARTTSFGLVLPLEAHPLK